MWEAKINLNLLSLAALVLYSKRDIYPQFPSRLQGIVKRRLVKPFHGSSTPPHSDAERPPLPATAHGWKMPLQRSDCGWAGVPAPFPVVALPDNHNPRSGNNPCEGAGSFGRAVPLVPKSDDKSQGILARRPTGFWKRECV